MTATDRTDLRDKVRIAYSVLYRTDFHSEHVWRDVALAWAEQLCL